MVKWSKPAKLDLKQIYDYIARDSVFYARKVSFEIVDKSQKLYQFPEIGRIVPEIANPNIRKLLIYSYRLIYKIFSDKIEVLALIHSRCNFIKDISNKQYYNTE